jgi:hypothetical protein
MSAPEATPQRRDQAEARLRGDNTSESVSAIPVRDFLGEMPRRREKQSPGYIVVAEETSASGKKRTSKRLLRVIRTTVNFVVVVISVYLCECHGYREERLFDSVMFPHCLTGVTMQAELPVHQKLQSILASPVPFHHFLSFFRERVNEI